MPATADRGSGDQGAPDGEKQIATLAEARALAHPLRLRILRLCLNAALTNRQIADQLGMDPGTVLHHVRTLVRTGFLAPDPVRSGARGALERPYRATGKSLRVDAGSTLAGDAVELAMVDAFRAQLADAGHDRVLLLSWLGGRLAPEALESFRSRLDALVEEFKDSDLPEGEGLGLFIGLHRQDRPQEDPPQPLPPALRSRRARPAR